jgi:hypothetical protein
MSFIGEGTALMALSKATDALIEAAWDLAKADRLTEAKAVNAAAMEANRVMMAGVERLEKHWVYRLFKLLRIA